MPPRINIPPVTRAVLSCIAVLSLLNGVARWKEYGNTAKNGGVVPYLVLVPGQFLLYPWTLLIATFVEQNIFTVLVNEAIVFYAGKYLERAWGSREFGKFILIVSLVSNSAAVLLYILCAAVFGNRIIATKGLCGGIAIQAAFLVAFKQLVPEHTVTVFRGIVKARVKHFPSIFLLANAIGAVVLGTHAAFSLSWLGFLAAWTYLRFYKRQPDLSGTSTGATAVKGDASEIFAFACFFPDAMQPPISFVAGYIFSALVAIRVCTPFSAEDIASGNEQAVARGQADLPSLLNSNNSNNSNNRSDAPRVSAKREEAERRRALALKALDQRLQAASASRAQKPSESTASQQPSQPQASSASTPPAPKVSSPDQSMLGETNYNPDTTSS